MANHLHRGAAAAALGALLAWHTPAHQISALSFFGSESNDAVDDGVAHIGSAIRDASAAAPSVGGAFLGGHEGEGQGASFQPSGYNRIPPEALAANVGDVLQNAVLSATSAAGGAAEAVMDTASHGLEEAKRRAAELYEAGTQHPAASVADAARRASQGAASAASGVASEAKRGFNALGSLLKEKVPGAAGAAYKTAKTASAVAGKAAEDLSEKAIDAKSAFLNWAQMLRDEMEKRAGSNRIGSQAAATVSDTAESARHAAIAAAEKASAAAKEARETLSGVGESVQSHSQGAADTAMQSARAASEKARSAYDTLEEAALQARAALDSWGTMIGNTLHAGTDRARDAAQAATETARHLAAKLQGAASNATSAAETLQDITKLFAQSANRAANRADQVVDGMTADVTKSLRDLLPWGAAKEVTEEGLQQVLDNTKGLGDKAREVLENEKENLKKKAGEACGCGSSMTGTLIAGACHCLTGKKWSLFSAAKNIFGFGQKVKHATDAVADTAASTSQGLLNKVESVIGDTGKKVVSSMNTNPPRGQLRPTDSAAWLGGLIGGSPATEEVAEGTPGVRETLPPVYREGVPLDCDPLPPYKDCIAQCDAEDARDAALAQKGLDSPRGLGSYDYSKKRGCYLACKSKWVDATLPGCIDTTGKIVAGTPPAAQYRTTTTTPATHKESDDDEENEGPASSWGYFMKRLHNEGQDAAHEVKEKVTPSTGNLLSWLFSRESPVTTTTTTTTMPPTRSGFFGSLFGRQAADNEVAANNGWMKGLNWGGLKHSMTSRTPAEETGIRETLTSTDRIETTGTNGFLMWCAAAVLLLALGFVIMVLKRWEAHHRERQPTGSRPQVVTHTEAEMERPLMH